MRGCTTLLCATLLRSNPYGLTLAYTSELAMLAIPSLRSLRPYPHLHQKTDTDVSVFIYDEGKHNFVVRNSVAVKPLRAGAHSPVQARSFHYHGTCVPTTPSPRNKTNTSACHLMLACEADIAACLWACPLQCGCVA